MPEPTEKMMRWTTTPFGWKRRFAWLPINIGMGDGTTEWVWLEWHWSRWCGDCYETRLQVDKPDD